MILLLCLAGTAAAYYAGSRTPGRGHGTVKGWIFALAMGLLLGIAYYAFSAYGLLFSLDSLFD